MQSRGIRGAITINADTAEQIEKAVVELYSAIAEANEFNTKDVSHVIFTVTKDIKSAYPAKFFRKNFDVQNVPLVCFPEMDIEGSLELCLRILVVVNTNKQQDEITHVYLRGAKVLRPDLAN